MTAMRTRFFILLALTGCQSGTLPSGPPPTDLGTISFPVGTYTPCAQGVYNPTGNIFVNSAGFESGAVLTLVQSGTGVTATYVDQNGLTQSLSFSVTTNTSAVLAQPGTVGAGFSSLCIMGPGVEQAYPATMTATAGALSYNAGRVFITLTGGLQSDAGACGKLSQSNASFWLECEQRQGGAPPPAGEPAGAPPVGQYSCASQVESYIEINGIGHFVADGATGTLALSAAGSKLTAQYTGDSSLGGTLRLLATTSTTAGAEAGQTLMAPCMIPPMGMPTQTPEPLPIAAGSLTVDGSTLFLSFAGTTGTGSSCPGVQVAGSLICTK
jgi:hypothetical protein